MNTELITNVWIPALRSGEYRQGKRALRPDEHQYCCLGVACDVIAGHFAWEIDDEFGDDWIMFGENGELPKLIYTELDIRSCGEFRVDMAASTALKDREPILADLAALWEQGYVSRNVRHGSLSELNDDHDWTFDQIADLLDAAIRHPDVITFIEPLS